MKIRRISIWQFARRLDGKAWNPAFRWNERRAPLLVIELDDGVRGIGEAWSGYTGMDAVLQVLTAEVAPALVGREVSNTQEISSVLASLRKPPETHEQAAAWSAADIALWDAFGHLLGEPIWRLLGGEHSRAPVYASGGLYRDGYSPEHLWEEARSYRERGFTAMKMKVAGVSRAEDLQRLDAARNGIGHGAGLWVDAVNQLSVASAKEFWKQLELYGVSAMQSPLPAEDVAGLSQLHAFGVPVIASEAEYRHSELHRLLEAKAVTHLQFCLPLCGGFSGATLLDARAAAFGVRTTPQCFSTVFAQAATLHFAAARPNVVSAEYHCFHDHLKDLFIGKAGAVQDGYAHAGEAPGLGVKIPALGVQADESVITRVAEAS